jgi:hypothetical protein
MRLKMSPGNQPTTSNDEEAISKEEILDLKLCESQNRISNDSNSLSVMNKEDVQLKNIFVGIGSIEGLQSINTGKF